MKFQLKFPSQIPLPLLFGYSLCLFFVQVLQGTSLEFACNIMGFHVAWGIIFNLLGGFTSVPGWLIALWGLRNVGISQLVKIFLGQAADTGLLCPGLTSEIYFIGTLIIALSALVIRWITDGSRTLVREHHDSISPKVGYTLVAVGLSGIFFSSIVPSGSFVLRVISNLFSSLGPIAYLGVIYEIHRKIEETQGEKQLSIFSAAVLVFLFCYGVISASKSGMFEPIFVVFVTAVFFGARIKVSAGGLIFLFVILMFKVLTPMSNHGRTVYRKESIADTIPALNEYIRENFSSFEKFQSYQQMLDDKAKIGNNSIGSYYDISMPLFERFSLIHDADIVISAYRYREPEGLDYAMSKVRFIPRVVTGDWIEQDRYRGDYIAKVAGFIGEDDDTTGISMGSFAEGFAVGKWSGVIFSSFLMAALCWVLIILDVRGENRIWSCYLVFAFQHLFSEVGSLTIAFVLIRTCMLLYIVKKSTELLEKSFSPK